MDLQHKSKLCVYKELKCDLGFEEYLQHVKGPSSTCRLFLKFRSCTKDFLRSRVDMLRGVGPGMS